MKKKIIYSLILIIVCAALMAFSMFFPKKERPTVGKAIQRRTQIAEKAQYFKLYENKKWDEIKALLQIGENKEKNKFLKQTQFLIDSKKVLANKEERDLLRGILVEYVEAFSAEEKGIAVKNLILAGRLVGKMGPLDSEDPSFKTVIKWLSSKKDYKYSPAFITFSRSRRSPPEFINQLKKNLMSKSFLHIQLALNSIYTMIDFEKKSELISYLEKNFEKINKKNQPMALQVLIANEKQLKAPKVLIQKALKEDGNAWEEAFLYILEHSHMRDQYIDELKKRSKLTQANRCN